MRMESRRKTFGGRESEGEEVTFHCLGKKEDERKGNEGHILPWTHQISARKINTITQFTS
jgi:hypothetical protein